MQKYLLIITFFVVLSGCASLQDTQSEQKQKLPTFVGYQDVWDVNRKGWLRWDPSLKINERVLSIYQEDSIRLNIEADKLLNPFNGASNTVAFKVLQLSRPDILGELTSSSQRMQTVFTDIEQSPHVIKSSEFTIAPNEIRKIVLDKEENVQYLLFVFGFNLLIPEKSSALLSIPAIKVDNKSTGYLQIARDIVDTLMFWNDSDDESILYRQAVLNIKIDVGDQQIKRFSANAE